MTEIDTLLSGGTVNVGSVITTIIGLAITVIGFSIGSRLVKKFVK